MQLKNSSKLGVIYLVLMSFGFSQLVMPLQAIAGFDPRSLPLGDTRLEMMQATGAETPSEAEDAITETITAVHEVCLKPEAERGGANGPYYESVIVQDENGANQTIDCKGVLGTLISQFTAAPNAIDQLGNPAFVDPTACIPEQSGQSQLADFEKLAADFKEKTKEDCTKGIKDSGTGFACFLKGSSYKNLFSGTMPGVPGCLKSFLKGIWNASIGTVQFAWDLAKGAWNVSKNWVKSFFTDTQVAEDATADKAMIAQSITPEMAQEIAKDPVKAQEGWFSKLLGGVWEMVASIGCEDWKKKLNPESGEEEEVCSKPMVNWSCSTCEQKSAVLCQAMGFISIGGWIDSFISGKAIGAIVKGWQATAGAAALKARNAIRLTMGVNRAEKVAVASGRALKAGQKLAMGGLELGGALGGGAAEVFGLKALKNFGKANYNRLAKLFSSAAKIGDGSKLFRGVKKIVGFVPKLAKRNFELYDELFVLGRMGGAQKASFVATKGLIKETKSKLVGLESELAKLEAPSAAGSKTKAALDKAQANFDLVMQRMRAQAPSATEAGGRLESEVLAAQTALFKATREHEAVTGTLLADIRANKQKLSELALQKDAIHGGKTIAQQEAKKTSEATRARVAQTLGVKDDYVLRELYKKAPNPANVERALVRLEQSGEGNAVWALSQTSTRAQTLVRAAEVATPTEMTKLSELLRDQSKLKEAVDYAEKTIIRNAENPEQALRSALGKGYENGRMATYEKAFETGSNSEAKILDESIKHFSSPGASPLFRERLEKLGGPGATALLTFGPNVKVTRAYQELIRFVDDVLPYLDEAQTAEIGKNLAKVTSHAEAMKVMGAARKVARPPLKDYALYSRFNTLAEDTVVEGVTKRGIPGFQDNIFWNAPLEVQTARAQNFDRTVAKLAPSPAERKQLSKNIELLVKDIKRGTVSDTPLRKNLTATLSKLDPQEQDEFLLSLASADKATRDDYLRYLSKMDETEVDDAAKSVLAKIRECQLGACKGGACAAI